VPKTNSIVDINGIQVGQAQEDTALTGCTVILCETGAVAGIDQRGGAPGTRETDLLQPMHLVEKVHAIVLSGGSAYGLDAASGVMRYLEEKKVGFNTGVARVPIVPAAVIFDLAVGDPRIRPDAAMGYAACQQASNIRPKEGNFGAGTGATVGKIFGMKQAMKSGIGTASVEIGGGVIVAAMMVVNAFGDVWDPETKCIISGARTIYKKHEEHELNKFADTLQTMKSFIGRTSISFASHQNTVIGVVATNAYLTKEGVNKVAQMSHNGIAATIRPAHTMFDGDTIFSLSLGKRKGDVSIIGSFAAVAVEKAILSAVRAAQGINNLPSASSILNMNIQL
jgi:L-aminopeptidase/D-esterase-like protein